MRPVTGSPVAVTLSWQGSVAEELGLACMMCLWIDRRTDQLERFAVRACMHAGFATQSSCPAPPQRPTDWQGVRHSQSGTGGRLVFYMLGFARSHRLIYVHAFACSLGALRGVAARARMIIHFMDCGVCQPWQAGVDPAVVM